MEEQLTNNSKEKVAEVVRQMTGLMNFDCQVEIKEERDDKELRALVVSIYAPDNGRYLIGKNGQNLKSMEQVLRAMFLRKLPEVNNIVVDVNDYKRSRANYIVDLAREVVTRVRSTQKAEALSPMSAYERRVVHMELASYPDIATESIGSEPNRRIVIKPYP